MTCPITVTRSSAVASPAELDIAQLARLHGAAVFRAAYRVLGEASAAEDVQQDVFLRLLESKPEPVDCWPAYLCTAATRAAIDRLRKQHRWWRLLSSLRLQRPAAMASVEQSGVDSERAHQLRTALVTLSRREAQCFSLRHMQQLEISEIAEALSMSENNVGVALHRTRRRLEAQIATMTAETIA